MSGVGSGFLGREKASGGGFHAHQGKEIFGNHEHEAALHAFVATDAGEAEVNGGDILEYCG